MAYKDGKGNWRRMCPDFVFSGDANDVKVSLVDPHGFHLGDPPQLRGLANYTIEYGDHFHRIKAVAPMKDATLRVLDLKKEYVRSPIKATDDAEHL